MSHFSRCIKISQYFFNMLLMQANTNRLKLKDKKRRSVKRMETLINHLGNLLVLHTNAYK